MLDLVLYSTAGCHLCEEADAVLRSIVIEHGVLAWQVRDITEDDQLVEKYGTRIPVLHLAGTEQDLGWPFTQQDVLDYIGA